MGVLDDLAAQVGPGVGAEFAEVHKQLLDRFGPAYARDDRAGLVVMATWASQQVYRLRSAAARRVGVVAIPKIDPELEGQDLMSLDMETLGRTIIATAAAQPGNGLSIELASDIVAFPTTTQGRERLERWGRIARVFLDAGAAIAQRSHQ